MDRTVGRSPSTLLPREPASVGAAAPPAGSLIFVSGFGLARCSRWRRRVPGRRRTAYVRPSTRPIEPAPSEAVNAPPRVGVSQLTLRRNLACGALAARAGTRLSGWCALPLPARRGRWTPSRSSPGGEWRRGDDGALPILFESRAGVVPLPAGSRTPLPGTCAGRTVRPGRLRASEASRPPLLLRQPTPNS